MDEELLTEKFLKEVRARVSDAIAAQGLLTSLVEEKGSEREQKYMANMTKSFYRLLRLIHHVEICKARTISQKRTLDLAGLCRDVSRSCEDMAKILGTEFDWKLSDSSVISVGDDHMLELGILNLLVNAFEAAGPTGKVILKGTLEKGNWVIVVTDNGPGIRNLKPDDDPYLKVGNGAGLGLEAAWRAAELHGGSLLLTDKGADVAPEGERGAKAILTLPVKKPEPCGADRKGLIKEPDKSVYRGGFSSVLVEFSPLLPAESFSSEDTK